MRCPECGKVFTERPAISRVDNKTEICSECGYRQAMVSIGIGRQEQDKILSIIRTYVREKEKA